jgi:hypothetical protein
MQTRGTLKGEILGVVLRVHLCDAAQLAQRVGVRGDTATSAPKLTSAHPATSSDRSTPSASALTLVSTASVQKSPSSSGDSTSAVQRLASANSARSARHVAP